MPESTPPTPVERIMRVLDEYHRLRPVHDRHDRVLAELLYRRLPELDVFPHFEELLGQVQELLGLDPMLDSDEGILPRLRELILDRQYLAAELAEKRGEPA